MSETGTSPCEFDLASGTYNVCISKAGYTTVNREVVYDSEVGSELDVTLVATSVVTAPVASNANATIVIAALVGVGALVLLTTGKRRHADNK